MEKINIKDYVNDIEKVFAHIDSNNYETLLEHSEKTYMMLKYIYKEKKVHEKLNKALNSLNISVKGINKNLSNTSKCLIIKMFINAIYLHDIGKINPKFQIDRMKNKFINTYRIKNLSAMNSKHSFLSSAIYMSIFHKEIKKIKNSIEKLFLEYILLVFSNSIYRHHGNLLNMEELMDEDNYNSKILNLMENFEYDYFLKKNTYDKCSLKPYMVLKNIEEGFIKFDGSIIFILSKLLFSLLVSCDFVATYSFYNKTDIKEDISLGLIKDTDILKNKFENSEIYKGIKEYEKNNDFFKLNPINAERSKMFLESEKNLIDNLDSLIFNLEMPTGAGKSFTSINLALKLLDSRCDKLFYIFPFNTLVDQNIKIFNEIFDDEVDIGVLNSIYPINLENNKNGEVDYKKTLLYKQILTHQITITSHVNLFSILFGNGREGTMPLFQLCNSVIVLDEIQTYKNSIWREIIELLYKYADILNIKIIIMSATLPNLQELIGFNKYSFVNLLKNPQIYYQNSLFKNRVKVDKCMLNKKVDYSVIRDNIERAFKKRNIKHKYSKCLVEFIKKKSAQEFVNKMKTDRRFDNYEILELTGDDNIIERERVLNIIKTVEDRNIILVSTQIIEAGVDIDMDLGFKDTALLDNDEQFIGRINRSCLKEDCIAYFFNLDAEKSIYCDDLRVGKNLTNESYFNYLINKDFKVYYSETFTKINYLKSELNENNIKKFYNDLLFLRFEDIANHMKLINKNVFQIYIPSVIEYKRVIKGKLQVKLIDGEKVWEEYNKIKKIKDYSQRRIKLINLNEEVSLFTYQLYGKGLDGFDKNSIHYIKEGEKFIVNNKFNKESFINYYTIIK